MRQPKQNLGNPRLEIEKGEILDLFVGAPQPFAQNHHQLDAKFGAALQQPQQRTARYDQKLAIDGRGRIGAALLAVEQSDFAENVALAKYRDDDLTSVRRRVA